MDTLLIQSDQTIREAIASLGEGGERSLIVVDARRVLIGSLSDGDVRRAVLSGKDLSEPLSSIMNRNPKWLAGSTYRKEDVERLFLEHRFLVVPVIDADGRVERIVTVKDIFGEAAVRESRSIDAAVVIMAGGQGTRLAPFTHVLPKPLIPINGKPIIEHVIDQFLPYSPREFALTVHHKSRILQAFFQELEPAYKVRFIEEEEPLGTAGGLRLLAKHVVTDFIVTNCDILAKLDYASLMDFHTQESGELTIVACRKSSVLPYGVCDVTEDGFLKAIKEKPENHFLVNTGLYVISPPVLDLIPPDVRYDMTQLIQAVCDSGGRVNIFPILQDSWHDVGEWSEYKKTVALFDAD